MQNELCYTISIYYPEKDFYQNKCKFYRKINLWLRFVFKIRICYDIYLSSFTKFSYLMKIVWNLMSLVLTLYLTWLHILCWEIFSSSKEYIGLYMEDMIIKEFSFVFHDKRSITYMNSWALLQSIPHKDHMLYPIYFKWWLLSLLCYWQLSR